MRRARIGWFATTAVAISLATGLTGCAAVNADAPTAVPAASGVPGDCPFMIEIEWDGMTGDANSAAAIRSMIEWNREQSALKVATRPGSVPPNAQIELLESALNDVSNAERAQASALYADRYLETESVSESGRSLGRVTTEKFAGGWVVTSMTFFDTDPALGLCSEEMVGED